MDWQKTYSKKLTSPEEAVSIVKNGDRVYGGQAAAIPGALVSALAARAKDLRGVTFITALSLRPNAVMKPEHQGNISTLSYFMGPQERALDSAVGGAASVNFNHLDFWIREIARPDIAFLEVTPPDEYGFFNLGNVNTCMIEDIMQVNPKIIVQVNKHVPYVYASHAFMHINDVAAIVEYDEPMPVLPNTKPTDIERTIAEHIIDMIPNGACIQIGLGGIGNAVGYSLEHKKDLGAHTEMSTDSMIYLAKKGVINCSKKNFLKGKFVAAMNLGSQEMYDFINRNPLFYSMALSRVTNEFYVAQNDNMISINNALAVDLTGQVCAETLGHARMSTTGGQLGFVRGAVRSKGGKSFILLSSTAETKNGKVSRINVSLNPGMIVTTPRSDVQYVGTEYGCVNLFGQPPDKRAKLMISIAHPDFREQLSEEARKYGLLK